MDVFPINAEGAPMKKPLTAALLSPEMNPERVGERVTALREALGKSKAQFADAIQLDRSSLTKIEAGSKGLDIAVGARIAEMFGAGLDYLYRGLLTDVPESLRVQVMAEIHAARSAKVLPKKTTGIDG